MATGCASTISKWRRGRERRDVGGALEGQRKGKGADEVERRWIGGWRVGKDGVGGRGGIFGIIPHTIIPSISDKQSHLQME